MKIRMPSGIEISIQVLLAIAFALFLSDYLHAVGASHCSAPLTKGGRGCYPWGAEGPAATFYYYRTAEIYLKTSTIWLGVLAGAIAAPFLTPNVWAGLGAVLVLLVIASSQLEWLTSLL